MDAPQTNAPVPLRILVRRDDLLRRLLTATLVDTTGRGAYFTLTALYFTTVVGIGAVAVGVALTIAGGVGVLASLVAGHLTDRHSTRLILVCARAVQGAGLFCYVFVAGWVSLVLAASLVVGAQQASSAARSAAVGRAFPGEDRVRIRSTMRAVTNAGISLGTAIAVIPLAIGTADAYRLTIAGAGVFYLASAGLLLGLDKHRIDAKFTGRSDATTETPEKRGSPYRDFRFLTLTAFTGVFAIQFALYEVAVPIWVVQHTTAPHLLVSVVLLVNTALVITLQVRLSRGTGSIAAAGRTMTRAGWLMAVACGLWACAGVVPVVAAVLVLLAAAATHTLAEILSSAAGWNLSFELADPERIGTYQGIYGTGLALGAMAGPTIVTATALHLEATGWAILAAAFVVSAGGVAAIARRSTTATVHAT